CALDIRFNVPPMLLLEQFNSVILKKYSKPTNPSVVVMSLSETLIVPVKAAASLNCISPSPLVFITGSWFNSAFLKLVLVKLTTCAFVVIIPRQKIMPKIVLLFVKKFKFFICFIIFHLRLLPRKGFWLGCFLP